MALTIALKTVATKTHFDTRGAEPLPTTPAALAKFQHAESTKWGKVIKAAGIGPQWREALLSHRSPRAAGSTAVASSSILPGSSSRSDTKIMLIAGKCLPIRSRQVLPICARAAR